LQDVDNILQDFLSWRIFKSWTRSQDY
jgi:hypothetical protein